MKAYLLFFIVSILLFHGIAYAQSLPLVPPIRPPELTVNTSFAEPTTNTDVDVFVDGKLSQQPKLTNLSEGLHTIKCSKRGYFDFEITIDFPKTDTIICFLSKTALLSINVKDPNGNKVSAKAYVDDQFKGFFDGGAFPLTKGLHTIRCAKEGYQDYNTTIEMTKYVPQEAGQAGTYYSLDCILKPLFKDSSTTVQIPSLPSDQKQLGFLDRIWLAISAFFKGVFK